MHAVGIAKPDLRVDEFEMCGFVGRWRFNRIRVVGRRSGVSRLCTAMVQRRVA
jgi:hypothetical protein